MRKRRTSSQKPKSHPSPFFQAFAFVFFTFIFNVCLSLGLIYFIRRHKFLLAIKNAQYQAFIESPPSDPILVKSKQIFDAFRLEDDNTLAVLLSTVDPNTSSEEYLKVLYDHTLLTKPHLSHLIISAARPSTLHILLQSNLVNANHHFLIHHAIANLRNSDLQHEILKMLCSHGADLNLADKRGFPPITVAIKHSNLSALQFLLANSVNLNVAFAHSPSFLHYAVTRRDPDLQIIQFLLSNSANAFHYSPDGHTAFHLALTLKPYNPDLIQIFLSAHNKENRLRLLNHPTTPKKVKNPSVSTRYGYTPLHIAVASYNIKLTKLLLSKGADPFRTDTSGLTPLDLAKQLKHPKLIKLLDNK